MKKISLLMFLALTLVITVSSLKSNAQSKFYDALKTCENYSIEGGAQQEKTGRYFSVSINMEKHRDTCVYKEKIAVGKDSQLLTCNFDKAVLPRLSTMMKDYNQKFKKEIAANPVFEAKLTANEDIFTDYLIRPEYCKITVSTSKK